MFMKKLIIFLLISIIGINVNFLSLASKAFENDITAEQFISSICKMIDAYGLYSNDVEYTNDVICSVKNFSLSSSPNLEEFQTRRLIVKSESNIDTLNAVSTVSGFRNLWVLQFETEEDTATAYEYYCSLDNVEFVEIDSLVTVSEMETVTSAVSTKSYLSWGPEHIGFDELNKIIAIYFI